MPTPSWRISKIYTQKILWKCTSLSLSHSPCVCLEGGKQFKGDTCTSCFVELRHASVARLGRPTKENGTKFQETHAKARLKEPERENRLRCDGALTKGRHCWAFRDFTRFPSLSLSLLPIVFKGSLSFSLRLSN